MRKLLLLCGAVALGSCGGSNGPGSVQQTPTATQLGEATINYSGNVKPSVLTSQYGITVAAMAGASISNFTVNPGSKINDTAIAWQQNGAIFEYQHGLTTEPFDQVGHYAFGLGYGHDGHLYFADLYADNVSKCFYDGSSITNVFVGAADPKQVAVAPNGQTVVFGDDYLGIYACPQTGNTYITLDASGEWPAISPNGDTVVYVRLVGSHDQLFTVPITGGTGKQLTTDSNNHYYPTYSPDGNSIVSDLDNGSNRYINAFSAVTGNDEENLNPGPFASHAAISPDGRYMVCESAASYPGTGQHSIVIQDVLGNNPQTIGTGMAPVWSPYPTSKTYVGSSGSMFTSAAGFIFPQIQTGLASLLTFTATTPSAATVTATQPGTNGNGPFVYDVHADDVTSIKYTNGYYDAPTTVTTGVSDAIVTVDSAAGLVQSVSPFVLTRGSSIKPVQVAAGLQYTAHFTGVWDAHGNNLAPNGASAITVDAKHGKVLSVSP